MDIVRDGSKKPAVDAWVGDRPVRISRLRHRRANDVRAKVELAAHGDKEGRPTGKVGMLQLLGDWNVRAYSGAKIVGVVWETGVPPELWTPDAALEVEDSVMAVEERDVAATWQKAAAAS